MGIVLDSRIYNIPLDLSLIFVFYIFGMDYIWHCIQPFVGIVLVIGKGSQNLGHE